MFGRDRWKHEAKMRKRPNFHVLRRGISPICQNTFLMTKFPVLSQQLATKLKKTVLLDQFHTVPSTFSLSLIKPMG